MQNRNKNKSTLQLNERLLDTKTMFSEDGKYMNPVKMVRLYGPE